MKKTINIILILCLTVACQAQSYQTHQWMGTLSKTIGNKPISSLILPGAGKAGINEITGSTGIPEKCSTQSQDTTIYGLLRRGARFLDLQLICRQDSVWYLGTYNYSILFGLQYATGQTLNSALSDLARFMSDAKHSGEIVILNISGYADSKKTTKPVSRYGEIDPVKKEKLFKKLLHALDPLLYKDKYTGAVTVNQVLESVQKKQDPKKRTGALILTFNDNDVRTTMQPGINRSDSCGSKADMAIKSLLYKTVVEEELKNHWQAWGKLNNSGCYTVMHWVLTWRSTDNNCNNQMALSANMALTYLLAGNKPAFYPQAICTFFFSETLTRQLYKINSTL